MAQVNGLKALFNAKGISNIASVIENTISNKMLESLQYIGEEFVNKARTNDTYLDKTGNLRSSIGYIILKNGVVIDQNFQLSKKGTDRYSGMNKAKEFSESIALQNTNGYVLIGVAGMEYAAYVEKRHHLDVITGSAPTKEIFKSILSEIKF